MALVNTTHPDLEANPVVIRDSAETRTEYPHASTTEFAEPRKPVFRQFANPAPLGLCGFALTTFVLSLVNVHARSVTIPNIVIGSGISLRKPVDER